MGMRKLSKSWASCKLSPAKAVTKRQMSSQLVMNGEAGGLLVLMIHISLYSSSQSVKSFVATQKVSGWVKAVILGTESVIQ